MQRTEESSLGFPLVTNYWSQASAIIEFINQKAKDGIQGKKLFFLS